LPYMCWLIADIINERCDQSIRVSQSCCWQRFRSIFCVLPMQKHCSNDGLVPVPLHLLKGSYSQHSCWEQWRRE
jgi:hypothetical protein